MKYRYPERLIEMDAEDASSALGGGFPFPVEVNSSGYVDVQEGVDHVKACLRHFALYDYGMLVGTPTFGGGVPSTLWQAITSNLIEKKEEQLRWGLEQWEPRITEIKVKIGQAEDDPTHLIELLFFEVESTGDTDYLKFPLSVKNDVDSEVS